MSDLGNLSNCVMDSDLGSTEKARRLRTKAFIASVFFEAVLIGAMLLWPLITPGVLPTQLAVTPLPPYRATRASIRIAQPHGNPGPASSFTPILLHPTLGQSHAAGAPGGDPPSPGDLPFGAGLEPGILGGGDGQPVELPSPTPPKGLVRVSEGVMAALLVHRVQPEYPAVARAMHLSGTVELRARIGTDGTVQALEVVSGNPILARAAVEAVQQWRYQPTRLSGQPVEVETHITVTFSMQQ